MKLFLKSGRRWMGIPGWLVMLAVIGVPAAYGAGSPLPSSHMIPNIVWHQQQNGLFCGPGSLEIVFDHYGPDINQKAIADVARSSSIGTWTFDMTRTGHFSHLSAAQGNYFPNEAPAAGFIERPLGYASFSHASTTFWLEELKAILAADMPVIVLNNFTPDEVGGDHYRVAIGYDDALGVIYFSDPWGRELKQETKKTGIISFTYEEFQAAWNRASYGTDLPYFGVVIAPWDVKVSTHGEIRTGSTIRITADITYPCPAPFDGSQFPASGATASITLPTGMTLMNGPVTQSLGVFTGGSTKQVSWTVRLDTAPSGKSLQVEAQGFVSGSVPEAHWNGQSNSYPPYSYTDAIGGTGSLQF